MGKIPIGIAMTNQGQKKVEKTWVELSQGRSSSK